MLAVGVSSVLLRRHSLYPAQSLADVTSTAVPAASTAMPLERA